VFIKYVAHQPAIAFSDIPTNIHTLKAIAVKPYQHKNSPRMMLSTMSVSGHIALSMFLRMHALGERQEEFLL
jgi:hypothetical protein